MKTELKKIQNYFDEGQKQWAINPEFVISKQFYELWEETYQPVPFSISNRNISIFNTTVSLANDAELVGCFSWNSDEECCCMDIQGERSLQKVMLLFEDGLPLVQEKPVVYLDIAELTFGERLEVIYDLIATVKKGRFNVDVRNLSKQKYISLLDSIANRYNAYTLKVMRQLSLRSVNRLMSKALEDMAADEISNQLVLPLDGTYASPIESGKDNRDFITPSHFGNETNIPSIKRRTLWPIARDLDFMKSAFESLANFEDIHPITFSSSAILKKNPDGSTILRVPSTETITVREGEELPVFRRGDQRPVAAFVINLYDKDCIVGKLSWHDPYDRTELDGDVFARPRKSPTSYIRTLLDHLAVTFQKKKAFPSPVLNAVLGVTDLALVATAVSDVPKNANLDLYQTRALVNAINPNNPLTLIQGPPGTGKTHLLTDVIRKLSGKQKRILMTAPSNTAVDNVCRRLFDHAILRLGNEQNSIAPDVRAVCWIKNYDAIHEFKRKRETFGSIYCGTHIGILRDDLINAELEKNGLFDVMVFDEAGMTRFAEFVLCIQLAKRAILFGDHQQLPPFPFPKTILEELKQKGPVLRQQSACITQSALEWLITQRSMSPYLLHSSYRCQNPRLMRFASTLFYDAQVKTSENAEYYQLSFTDRQKKYPPSTLRLFRTSNLPLDVRKERLFMEGRKPGLENALEATIAVDVFYELLRVYPLSEITIIAPYRRQVRLIRSRLSYEKVQAYQNGRSLSESEWEQFLYTRISTVDSFQGGESDAVIICYVRSNEGNGIGFVDDPNRINVAHTRCRREMVVIGDLECLKKQSRNTIFERLERAVQRDGEIIDVTPEMLDNDPF